MSEIADQERALPSDRATQASPQAPSGLGHSVSIPSATCTNCDGSGWVCENHADRPWGGLAAPGEGCDCGAGMPCGVCNLEMASVGFVDRREKAIAVWLRELKFDDSDNVSFDDGWSSAIAWAAWQIENGRHWAAAQAIEAAKAGETGTGSTEGESAVPQECAPNNPPNNPS